MLDHVGDAPTAARIRTALNDVLHSGKSLTSDLGGNATTTGFADAIIARLA
jgi:isocitrate dehydrogenase (NAD+)